MGIPVRPLGELAIGRLQLVATVHMSLFGAGLGLRQRLQQCANPECGAEHRSLGTFLHIGFWTFYADFWFS